MLIINRIFKICFLLTLILDMIHFKKYFFSVLSFEQKRQISLQVLLNDKITNLNIKMKMKS